MSIWQSRRKANMENEVLQPQLERAQAMLESALDQACGVNIAQASTDELVRVEETLATASGAAKEVVSIRLLRRQRRAAKPSGPGGANAPRTTPADMAPSIAQRIFEDVRGTRWRVF